MIIVGNNNFYAHPWHRESIKLDILVETLVRLYTWEKVLMLQENVDRRMWYWVGRQVILCCCQLRWCTGLNRRHKDMQPIIHGTINTICYMAGNKKQLSCWTASCNAQTLQVWSTNAQTLQVWSIKKNAQWQHASMNSTKTLISKNKKISYQVTFPPQIPCIMI
jgi:hypothetical protein